MKSGDISWCLKQNRGLKLVNPSSEIAESYFKKAEGALNMLQSALEKKEMDWIVTTAYYAKYLSLYALLAKCGIKCEIHDCTISAMNVLLVESGLVKPELHTDIEESKDLRIKMQYYLYREFEKEKVMKLADSAPDFVLQMRQAIDRIGSKEIEQIRSRLSG
jgi:uncharacterized protein (UPF0332 family)